MVHEGRSVPERWTFFIDRQGKIMAIDQKVNAESHGQDCAKKLADLKVAKKK